MINSKVCTNCKEEKPLEKFGTRKVNGKVYPKTRCRQCRYRVEISKGWLDPVVDAEKSKARYDDVYKVERATGVNRSRYILTDSRRDDKKRGRDCDLDIEYIDALIAHPCCYCGEREKQMTLDRVDNTKGHIKGNVVPACKPCNVSRQNKPIADWIELCLAKGMQVSALAIEARDHYHRSV